MARVFSDKFWHDACSARQVMHPRNGAGEVLSGKSKLPVWHYWVYWTGVLCAIAAALTSFSIIGLHRSRDHFGGDNPELALRHAQSPSSISSSELEIPNLRLYPYSVIPGGVRSVQELRSAIAHDPLVAALFANFDLSRAYIARLARDREVYVSYRLGDHIYWTKKRLLLRAGETVITDGKHEARTRCGNRISETPVRPVSQNEPPSVAMNAPPSYTLAAEGPGFPPSLAFDPPVPDQGSPVAPPPPPNPPIFVIPPPDFPIVGGSPPSFPSVTPPPPPPPVATPEPGTSWLLGFGLLAVTAAGGFATFAKERKT
jgi:hypothetical protein